MTAIETIRIGTGETSALAMTTAAPRKSSGDGFMLAMTAADGSVLPSPEGEAAPLPVATAEGGETAPQVLDIAALSTTEMPIKALEASSADTLLPETAAPEQALPAPNGGPTAPQIDADFTLVTSSETAIKTTTETVPPTAVAELATEAETPIPAQPGGEYMPKQSADPKSDPIATTEKTAEFTQNEQAAAAIAAPIAAGIVASKVAADQTKNPTPDTTPRAENAARLTVPLRAAAETAEKRLGKFPAATVPPASSPAGHKTGDIEVTDGKTDTPKMTSTPDTTDRAKTVPTTERMIYLEQNTAEVLAPETPKVDQRLASLEQPTNAGQSSSPAPAASVTAATSQPLTAGAPVPSTPPTLNMTTPAWTERLVENISSTFNGDTQEIEITLTPETLGKIQIRVEAREGATQVMIVTETAEASRLFSQQEARISEMMSRSGLSLESFSADSRQRGEQAGDGRNARGQSAAGTNGSDAPAGDSPTLEQSPSGTTQINLIA